MSILNDQRAWLRQKEFRISIIVCAFTSELQVQHSESAFYQLSYSGFNYTSVEPQNCAFPGMLSVLISLHVFCHNSRFVKGR